MKLEGERLVPKGNNQNAFYWEHIKRYQFAEPYIVNKKVLDLGCGTGYGSAELISMGAKSVDAVDLSRSAIDFARAKYSRNSLSFKVADALNLPFKNNTFDCVVSFEVIKHVKDYKKYLTEALRVLKNGGFFIFSTPNIKQYRQGTSHYHVKEFSSQELAQIFKKMNLPLILFGQIFKNHQFINEQKQYFRRYQYFTLGGSKTIKKIYHLIPSRIKAAIYKYFFSEPSRISKKEIIISKKHIDKSITLIGLSQKTRQLTALLKKKPKSKNLQSQVVLMVILHQL